MSRLLTVFLSVVISLHASAQYNVKKMMEEGQAALSTGYYIASMDIFNRLVLLKPELNDAWYYMAKAKYHLEDYEGAEQDCTRAILLNPFRTDYLDLRAMVRIKEEKYDSAAIDYTKAIELRPDDRNLWYNRAYCYHRAGVDDLALEQLNYILSRWKEFTRARQLRREIIRKTKNKS